MEAVSSVLVQEEDSAQTPIYYVSKVLNGAEYRYPSIEKTVLALVITARKLCPYFISYPVWVRTNTPIKQVLSKAEAFRRLVKWAIELSEYDILHLPRTTIKTQALPDFVFEKTGTTQREVLKERLWLLHVDGSSTTQEIGAGVVITSSQGEDMEFTIKFDFKASNNEAEYEALVIGMRMAQDVGALHLLAYSDSQLIVKQVSGEYEAKEKSMVQYLQQIEELKTKFKSFQLQQIPMEENAKADSLSKLASTLEDCKTRRITVQHLPQPRAPLNIQAISLSDNDWRVPIIRWIDEGHLPENRWGTTRIKVLAIRFLTQGGTLYKKSFTHPLLRCQSQEEGLHVLKEIYDGYCGSHIGT
ncbi:UNVERIFIED_CONTAM: Ribonuclease HI [Sesamum radiatum]|uniref:Ribonuclease HI n=1 Tax=Sesamum radiatum TaxID=300843 RepID=A0AAW2K4D1_SESRA